MTSAVPEVAASEAVPPGRVRFGRARDRALLCRTFVSSEAWRTLSGTGTLAAREEHIDPEWRTAAYRWMAREVRERLGEDDDGVWPLWLWARTTRAVLVDHARQAAVDRAGEVLVTCRVPRARLVLSSYSAWHAPLNDLPVFSASLSEDAYERALDAWWDRRDVAGVPLGAPLGTWPAVLRDEVLATWPAIFDPATWYRREALQACTTRLELGDVVSAVRIRPAG